MSKIFETHAHYEDEAFDEDREALLASLPANNIEYVVDVGSTIETCHKIVDMLPKYPFMYGALGIHPSEIREVTEDDLKWIKDETLANDRIVAIGEIGLDYYWDKDNKEDQKAFFIRQMDMAKELKKPIIVHSRDAALDTYEVMKSNNASECGGVIHCFSYSVEEAKKYLDMGFYIGLGGVVTFKNAVKAKEVAQYVPMDRLLLETDCPYMAPVPYRGKRNSSLYIPEIVKVISEIKGTNYDEIIEKTNQNAREMYKIECSKKKCYNNR